MSAPPRPSEEEMHAYIDGELAADRHLPVAAYLREHPAEAMRLEAYRADGEAIARVFARAPRPRAPQRSSRSFWRREALVRIAASVLVVAAASAAGLTWYRRGRVDETVWARFGAEALAAHLALSNSDSPPRMAASLREIAAFLSAAVNAPMRLEDPANPEYALVGSRFLSGGQGRVAQLAFRDGTGVLVTMFFEPWPGKRDAPFRPLAAKSSVRTIGASMNEIGCGVTGALPADELERIADALYAGLVKS